jgi:hypothetical protein
MFTNVSEKYSVSSFSIPTQIHNPEEVKGTAIPATGREGL